LHCPNALLISTARTIQWSKIKIGRSVRDI
jgi:hypothetical protein